VHGECILTVAGYGVVGSLHTDQIRSATRRDEQSYRSGEIPSHSDIPRKSHSRQSTAQGCMTCMQNTPNQGDQSPA